MATDYLTKIQALLNKAESTTFEAEAEALMAKAQELMTTHAIDEAMLASEGKSDDEIVTEIIVVENPYLNAKLNILVHICMNNNVKVVTRIERDSWGDKVKTHMLVGWKSDVESSTMLFGALLLHATRAMLAAKPAPGENTKSFRQSFLIAYGSRVGARLGEAKGVATAGAEEAHGSSMALVLVDRSAAVDAAHAEAFPNAKKSKGASYRNNSGVGHGTRAGNAANLGQRSVGGSRRALNA